MYKSHVSEEILKNIMQDIKKDGIQKIVVSAVIFLKENCPLLLKRTSDDFMGGLVEIPGGTMESSETVSDALVREIKEETGLSVSIIESYLGHFDYISASGKKVRQLNFRVATVDSDVVLSDEHEDFFVLNIFYEAYKKLNISDETKKVILSAL